MKNFSFLFVFSFAVVFSAGKVAGQTTADSLHLIPMPQKIVSGNGRFTFRTGVRVYTAPSSDSAVQFAVNLLLNELEEDLQIRGQRDDKIRKSALLIGVYGRDEKFDRQTASYAGALQKCGSEGYVLHVDPRKIILLARSDTGVFYGVQTLRQLIRGNRKEFSIPALTITDWPALRFRGWQDDISRGPIPTMTFLKKEIRTMAFFKMNIFTLYTENVFRLKSHPDLAPPDAITAGQIKELSAYAQKYHVNLVGNFQAFGHFRKILEKPEYQHLAETPSVISPAFPETYKLLNDILKEIASAYSSKYFMINCDEVFGLGSGPAKTMVDTMGLAGVYAYHIRKLVQILKPFHKTILMWGDIARDYPEIIAKLPKDIIVLPWAYQAAPDFKSQIEPFKKAGMHFWVAPGVSCWGQIFPAVSTAKVNIAHFVRDGKAMGAEGMLNTTWDDDGENLFSMNWLPLAWGAACAWNPVMSVNDTVMNHRFRTFAGAFDPLFYGAAAGVTQNILHLDALGKNPAAGQLSDRAFWKPLFGRSIPAKPTSLQLAAADSLKKAAGVLIQNFRQAQKKAVRNQQNIDDLIFAAERVRWLAEKNALRYRLENRSGRKLEKKNLRQTLDSLENQLVFLKKTYAVLWNRENRPWWLNHNLARYNGMQKALKAVPYHVFIRPDTLCFAPVRTVSLYGLFPDDKILYTLHDSVSDTTCQNYEKPIRLQQTVLLKTCVAPVEKKHPVFQKTIRIYHGPVEQIVLQYPFSSRYKARGTISLVDQVRGSKNFRDGHWLGFQGVDFIADIRLKKPTDIDSVTITFLQNMRSWILFPEWVSCSVSKDGKHYVLLQKIPNAVSWHSVGAQKQTFSFPVEQKGIRFIRLRAKNTGKLPAWHPGAGQKAWLFTDEITLK